jgi:hypothetical protein
MQCVRSSAEKLDHCLTSSSRTASSLSMQFFFSCGDGRITEGYAALLGNSLAYRLDIELRHAVAGRDQRDDLPAQCQRLRQNHDTSLARAGLALTRNFPSAENFLDRCSLCWLCLNFNGSLTRKFHPLKFLDMAFRPAT